MTVQQVQELAMEAFQRRQLLLSLRDLLDALYGSGGEEPPERITSPDGGWLRPARCVVRQLDDDLRDAALRAYGRYRALSSTAVADVDEKLLEQDEEVLG